MAAPPKREITREMLPALYEAGEQSVLIDKLDEATWCFERALAFEPGSPRALRGLAQVHHQAGRPEAAREAILAAHAHGLDEAETYTLLGQFHQAAGEFTEALAAFDHAIAVRPLHGPAWLRRALLHRPGGEPAPLARMEQLLATPGIGQDDRAMLEFALARECERAGETDRAFAQYRAANEVRHAQYPGYAGSFDRAEPVMEAFPASLFAARRGWGDASGRPVFVVGMMRSGTTLVEQILASHPCVHGHGEMSSVRQIIRAIPVRFGDRGTYLDHVARLDRQAVEQYAARYLADQERTAPQAIRGIDKMPHNFEFLGVISLLFPKARILWCRRDARDSCWSCYTQDFGALNPFTYQLATLGHYHVQMEQLMRHWQAVLPNPILEVEYEALVGDLEGQSRRMTDFLDLAWDPACLEFHANSRPVFTKSLQQVRQKLFTHGIGRWRRYAAHLGPLLDALGMPNP